MAEWFKNICLSPFKYGLNKVNYIAINAITVLFNLYGKRLLKIDMDNIIKKNECVEDRDNFYLHPLQLKEIEQIVGLNVIKIDNGTINDIVISVPWKAMLSEPTFITISSISLKLSLSKNINSIYFSALENSNSYFGINNKNINENQDLLNTYKEINGMLTKYFNRINLKIDLIECVLIDHFKIVIHNLEYVNGAINVDKIIVCSLDKENHKLIEVNKLNFIIESDADGQVSGNSKLSVNELVIDPFVVDYLPNFYTDNSKSNFDLDVSINTLRMDKIMAKEILFCINPNHLVVKKLSYLDIDDILLLRKINTDKNLFVFDIDKNICSFEQQLQLKLGSISELIDWITYFNNVIDTATKRMIVMSIDELPAKKQFYINNVGVNVIYGDDPFNIQIKQISTGNNVILNDVNIQHNDIDGIVDSIVIEENGEVTLQGAIIQSNKFSIVSNTTKIIKTNTKLDLLFVEADTTGITEIVNFVTSMIDKFSTPSKEETKLISQGESMISQEEPSNIIVPVTINPFMVNLLIRQSNINFKHEHFNFKILVSKADVCITTKSANHVIGEVLMNNYLILKLCAKHLSSTSFLVESLKIYMDPEIFDQMNYLFGTLTPESSSNFEPTVEISEEGLEQLRNALSKSMVSTNISNFENIINNTTNTIIENHSVKISQPTALQILNSPNIKLLSQSFTNLRDILIDNYVIDSQQHHKPNMRILVQSVHLFLFDKLSARNKNIKNDIAFLCFILKDIDFMKIEQLPNRNEPSVLLANEPIVHIINTRTHTKIKQKYILKINTGAIIDITCQNPEWKYFVKFSNDNMLNATAIMYDDVLRANINLSSLSTNIREETLLRILAFFSNSHHAPKNSNPIFIEYFNINGINVTVNYLPLVLRQVSGSADSFALKNFKIVLTPQIITQVNGLDKLINIMGEHWKKDVNPNNILQFLPNIQIIQPYATPIVRFIQLTTKYFKHAKNKKKIRAITKNLNRGANMITGFVKHGIDHVWELFN